MTVSTSTYMLHPSGFLRRLSKAQAAHLKDLLPEIPHRHLLGPNGEYYCSIDQHPSLVGLPAVSSDGHGPFVEFFELNEAELFRLLQEGYVDGVVDFEGVWPS